MICFIIKSPFFSMVATCAGNNQRYLQAGTASHSIGCLCLKIKAPVAGTLTCEVLCQGVMKYSYVITSGFTSLVAVIITFVFIQQR